MDTENMVKNSGKATAAPAGPNTTLDNDTVRQFLKDTEKIDSDKNFSLDLGIQA